MNFTAHFTITRPCYFFYRSDKEYRIGFNSLESGRAGDRRENVSCGEKKKRKGRKKKKDVDMSRSSRVFP